MNVLKDRPIVYGENHVDLSIQKFSLGVLIQRILSAHLFATSTTTLFGLAIRPLVPRVSADAAVLWILLITGTSWANLTIWPINFSTYCGKRQWPLQEVLP